MSHSNHHKHRNSGRNSNEPGSYNVIVIGAGISGLACARELQGRRYRVLVVEGRTRVGGRVCGIPIQTIDTAAAAGSASNGRNQHHHNHNPNNSHATTAGNLPDHSTKSSSSSMNGNGATLSSSPSPTSSSSKRRRKYGTSSSSPPPPPRCVVPIDMGGALIHGTKENPLSRICVQLGVTTSSDLQDCLLLESNSGWPIDSKLDDKMSQLFNKVLEETFARIREQEEGDGEERKEDLPKSGMETVTTQSANGDLRTKIKVDDEKRQGEELVTLISNKTVSGESKPKQTNNNTSHVVLIDDDHGMNGSSTASPNGASDCGLPITTDAAMEPVMEMAATTVSPSPNDHGVVNDDHNGISDDNEETKAAERKEHGRQKGLEVTTPASNDNNDNFGTLFHSIAFRYLGNHPPQAHSNLWDWYQANLELSCGAPFDRLGYQWNDDEPYGFEGAHVALRDSWTPIVEALAEPLNIVLEKSVTNIKIMGDDRSNNNKNGGGDSEQTSNEGRVTMPRKRKRHYHQQNDREMGPQPSTETGENKPQPSSSVSTKAKKTNGARDETLAPAPTRRSQRCQSRLVGASMMTIPVQSKPTVTTRAQKAKENKPRRSARASKPTALLSIAHHDWSYDVPTSQTKSKERKHQKRPRVQVTLNDGTVLEADFVVCTLPLGILKSDRVTFDPPLPERKQRAIDELGCGLLNKCILSFEKVFWQDSDFLGICDDAAPFLILNGHKYTSKPVLIFMFGGQSAFDVEGLNDEELVEECLGVLKKVAHSSHVPEPIDYLVTRWGQDPFAKMCFSYVPPNTTHDPNPMSVLGEPIVSKGDNMPRVMFAGEHTTPFHPSTIHGAWLSGIREAYRLDLTLEPGLNNGLDFDPNAIYQKTFQLKRKFMGTPSQEVVDGAKQKSKQDPDHEERKEKEKEGSVSRRNSRVVTLRKRTASSTTVNGTIGDSTTTRPSRKKTPRSTSPTPPPSRKSQRILTAVPKTDSEDSDDVLAPPRPLKSPTYNQDLFLKRLIGSYESWRVIQQKVQPFYGGLRSKSLKQRYQMLKRTSLQRTAANEKLLEGWTVTLSKATNSAPTTPGQGHLF